MLKALIEYISSIVFGENVSHKPMFSDHKCEHGFDLKLIHHKTRKFFRDVFDICEFCERIAPLSFSLLSSLDNKTTKFKNAVFEKYACVISEPLRSDVLDETIQKWISSGCNGKPRVSGCCDEPITAIQFRYLCHREAYRSLMQNQEGDRDSTHIFKVISTDVHIRTPHDELSFTNDIDMFIDILFRKYKSPFITEILYGINAIKEAGFNDVNQFLLSNMGDKQRRISFEVVFEEAKTIRFDNTTLNNNNHFDEIRPVFHFILFSYELLYRKTNNNRILNIYPETDRFNYYEPKLCHSFVSVT